MSRKSDLEVLRDILLAQDRQILEELRQEIEALKAKVEDPGEFLRIIEPVISEAIAQRSRTHPEEVAKALAPAIADAVKYQIEENRDAMVTALIPIVGALIRRSIQEAFQSLARRVDQRLRQATSIQLIVQRLWARIRGVPPGEVVLRESLPWSPAAVFLIDNESGIILAQVQRQDSLAGRNPHLTAALLTAIRNFARETFSNGQPGTLYELNVDPYTVLMEEGPDVYIAWVGMGVAPADAHHRLRDVLAEIYARHRDMLKDAASRQAHGEMLAPFLEPLLEASEEDVEPAGVPTLGLAIVTGVLVGVLFLCSWGVYRTSPKIMAHLMPTAVHYLTPTPIPTFTPTPTPGHTLQPTFTPTPASASTPESGILPLPKGPERSDVHGLRRMAYCPG